MTNLKEAMDQFARRMGLPTFEAESDGSFTVTFDGQHTIDCRPDGPAGALLSAVVGPLPSDARSRGEKLRDLLRRNLALMHTQGEILALDGDTGQIILYVRVALPRGQVLRLEQVFENFVNNLASWRAAVQDRRVDPQPIPIPFR